MLVHKASEAGPRLIGLVLEKVTEISNLKHDAKAHQMMMESVLRFVSLSSLIITQSRDMSLPLWLSRGTSLSPVVPGSFFFDLLRHLVGSLMVLVSDGYVQLDISAASFHHHVCYQVLSQIRRP